MSFFATKCRNRMDVLLLGAFCYALLSGFWGNAHSLHAAVIVFSNESLKPVTFIIGNSPSDQSSHKAYKVTPGDVLSLPVDEIKTSRKMIWFDTQQNAGDQTSNQPRDIQSMTLVLNSIYTFTGEKPLALKKSFGVDAPVPASDVGQTSSVPVDAVLSVPVMILVDDEEPYRQEIWERKLRERIKKASDIFEKTCRIRFEVVKVGTWETNDQTTKFEWTLREFQQHVKPEPGIALVIGFTSQYEVQNKKRFHMGGTRGLLCRHILIREWSQHVGRPERLELLVHELGHVFGATHSPDQRSSMRPVVGDKRANLKSFRIGFDPLNTLAMYLFCESLRLEGVRSLPQLPPESRTNLMLVYRELGRRFPKDNSATLYQNLLQRTDRKRFVIPKKTRRPSIWGQ